MAPALGAGCCSSSRNSREIRWPVARLEALAGRCEAKHLRGGSLVEPQNVQPRNEIRIRRCFFPIHESSRVLVPVIRVLDSGSTRRATQISEKTRKKSRCQLIMDICKLSASRMLVASLTWLLQRYCSTPKTITTITARMMMTVENSRSLMWQFHNARRAT